ncbi:MAG: methionine--tRNA ligase [Polyangiales bacterium]
MDRFYVTTPIYYVNATPHVGNAYTTIVADALRRYHGLRGRDAYFLTGTDEHGLKIEREATKREVATKDYVDEMSARFNAVWPKLDVRPDVFYRTTDPTHEARVQAWWERCAANGDIYLGSYSGLYCVSCEELKTEKELLPGNLCPIHERPVEPVTEPSYFFRLSAYGERLLKFYESHPEFVRPEGRRNEVISFVREGLKDLSVSRTTFTWGVPVPGDPKHVMYVWFDALFNYLTAVEDPSLRERFWPCDAHLVGKDILRFHAVYWPAFLMSAGLPDAQLPRTVFAHGFLLRGGRKISKTARADDGTTATTSVEYTPGTFDPARLAEVLGADALRFYLLREVAFGQDGEFFIPAILDRARSELGETIGNLLHRVMPFAKHFDGRVPAVDPSAVTEREATLREKARVTAEEVACCWEDYQSHRGLELVVELARAGNRYFDESAPWKLAKNEADRPRLAAVLATVTELLAQVATMLWPAIPTKAEEIRRQLGLAPLAPAVGHDLWPRAWGLLAEGTTLQPGSPVFPKYDAAQREELLEKLDVRRLDATPAEAAKPEKKPAEKKAEKKPEPAPEAPPAPIGFDDFAKVDLRLGKVLTAERVPKKDMLLKLSVDLGEAAPRTIVAGIAQSYAPEALVGKQVVVVANLEPRAVGGIVSQGMLLACGPKDGLGLATFERALTPGTRVK